MLKLGIHKRWNKKFLLRELARCVIYPTERKEELERLDRKNEEEVHSFADGLRGPTWASTWHGLKLLRISEYYSLSTNKVDYKLISLGLLYQLRAEQMWHARELDRSRSGAASTQSEDLARTTEIIASAFSLGWIGQASELAEAALSLIPQRAYRTADPARDLQYEPYRMCFGRFVLQLYADFAGREMPSPMPRHPYESPVYDALLKTWRASDPEALVDVLLAACDWHTHECMYSRSLDPSKRVDFGYDIYMGWPIEVHMVYRLREALGLQIPAALDHPLMQTPLAAYLPPCQIPDDGVIGRMTKRAIEHFPLMAEMV